MGRAMLWAAAVCSVLIALNTNAVGWTTSPTTQGNPGGSEEPQSFGDLYQKLKQDVKSFVTTIKNLVINAESELLQKTKGFAKPLVEGLVREKEEEFNTVVQSLYAAVNNYIANINGTRNMIRDSIRNGVANLKQVNKTNLIAGVERIIKDKEYKLTGILLSLNLTKDPILLQAILEAIYTYPQSKEDLGILLRTNLFKIIFEKYLEFSNDLKCEIKVKINEIIKNLEKYIYTKEESEKDGKGNAVDHFIIIEAANVIQGAIDALLDKFFSDADERNKKKLDDAIDIDKNVIISVGNTVL